MLSSKLSIQNISSIKPTNQHRGEATTMKDSHSKFSCHTSFLQKDFRI